MDIMALFLVIVAIFIIASGPTKSDRKHQLSIDRALRKAHSKRKK